MRTARSISAGEAIVLASPIAIAAAAGKVTDFWAREITMPPGESFVVS